MLSFIGLGLHGAEGISIIGLDSAKKADIVYLDIYTSPIAQNEISSLQNLINKDIILVNRTFIEDEDTILKEAKQKEVALIVPGDPIIATTHMDLRLRAEDIGIKTKLIHGSSILCALPGETGLHNYSFGKPVTLMRSAHLGIISVYEVIYENLIRGLHTIIFLEYDQSTNFFLNPKDALESLLTIEKDLNRAIFNSETFIIVASRIGSQSQALSAGSLGMVIKQDLGEPPHIIIVPGKLHFTEIQFLKSLFKMEENCITDNSLNVNLLSKSMVVKYANNTNKALQKARTKINTKKKKKFNDLFENIECYVSDAERFLNSGKYELAILSIGYAEGLLDSLRFIGELDIDW